MPTLSPLLVLVVLLLLVAQPRSYADLLEGNAIDQRAADWPRLRETMPLPEAIR
jgi:hypothetical protein